MNQLQIGFNRAMTQGPFGPMGPHSNIVRPNGAVINKVWQPNITLPHHGLDTWGLNPHNQYYRALTQFRLHKHKPRLSARVVWGVSLMYPSSMVAIRKKHNDATSPVFRQRLSFHDGDFPISFIQVLGSPQPKEPVNSHGDVKTNIHLHTFAILQSSVPSGKLTWAIENHHVIMGFIHYKWPFSIAMLNYQRVIISNIWCNKQGTRAKQLSSAAGQNQWLVRPPVPPAIPWSPICVGGGIDCTWLVVNCKQMCIYIYIYIYI